LRTLCAGVEVVVRKIQPRLVRLTGMLRYLLQQRPPELSQYESDELASTIRRLHSSVGFDVVQIEHSLLAFYGEAFSKDPRCKRLLVIHNVTSQQRDRIARLPDQERRLRTSFFAWTMGRWEPRYAERFDRCITVSEANRQLLMSANPRLRVDVIPNGVDTRLLPVLPCTNTAPTLLFVGTMGYEPNEDAVLYFCRDILPIIRRTVPAVQLWIVGRDPSPAVSALASDTVHVSGRVDDVVPYYQRSAVAIVPLRAGGGTRLKILEAMALGRPVVTTSIGCEGLDVRDNDHVLIADTAESFAARTVQLVNSPELCQSIAARARELVVNHYDWDAIAGQMLRLYDELT
jgi:polysaccharide biosynthesis protein PslH